MEITRKAIIYRATHRGTKEADWLIGGFIRAHLTEIPDQDIPALKALIDLDDESFFKQVEKPEGIYQKLIKDFKRYKASL